MFVLCFSSRGGNGGCEGDEKGEVVANERRTCKGEDQC